MATEQFFGAGHRPQLNGLAQPLTVVLAPEPLFLSGFYAVLFLIS
jgi:hypothetical protein